jgi:Carboxypeptidase regulatory-like domain/S-layer homology domain
MYRSSAKRLSAFLVSVGLFLTGGFAIAATQSTGQTPKVRFSTKNRTSKPLREYQFVGPVQPRAPREIKNEVLPGKSSRATGRQDNSVQRQFGLSQPIEQLQFDGTSDDDNQDVVGGRVVPPDTEGDVGPNHYMQWNNLVFEIFDKSGNTVLGPLPGNAFWEGLGGFCETQNDGDPIVVYDQLADRWMVSQFAFPNFPSPPYIQCVAVSVTGDPTGEYHQYEFDLPDTFLNDYPKFGMWPDGYYFSFNGFDVVGGGFQGGAIALDRNAMLDGNPATMIEFNTGAEGGVLPTDLEGTTPPPVGAPNYFLTWEINPSRLLIWQFHADFETPANSTFTGPVEVPVDDFVSPICGSFRDQCVPQLDSGELLETLANATMWRMGYRNFGDHESLVVNHTVDAGGQIAGIRWYEIRNPGGTAPVGNGAPNPVVVYQQQTYAPDDGNFRWMGSIAMDHNGNLALGYSISSSEMHPSIAITGRLATDPLNLMGDENIFLAGTGSQVDSFSRWGDYSNMTVDPVDDCTFWYTQEYYQDNSSFDFKTRIASFKFPSCSIGPTGTIAGTVTDGTNPLAGVKVTADLAQTLTDASGNYSITLPVGTYDMTASKYGYFPASADDVPVIEDETTTQNFELEVAPSTLVNGTVKDSVGGWPLYAKIVVSGSGFPGATFYTDPVTGYYETTLVVGSQYTFVITAVSQGYQTGGGIVDLSAVTHAPAVVKNWTLEADPASCNAPGYGHTNAFYDDFSTGDLSYWTVVNNSTDGGQPWKAASGADPCGLFPGNQTGGSGPYAIVNSNCDGTVTDDTDMISPSVNLSTVDAPVIQFASDFSILDPGFPQTGGVDYSLDGGANWTNVLTLTDDDPGPSLKSFPLPANSPDVQVRFTFDGFWAWWWQVDNVLVGDPTCAVGTGGLTVGNVKDANTNSGLNGATVEVLGGSSTKTFATPDDPNVDDGFYILYADSGNQTLQASMTNFQSQQKSTVVVPGSTQRLDFSLQSGHLTAAPSPLNARVDPGGTDQQTLTLTNSGGAPAHFEIVEINAPLVQNNSLGHYANKFMQQQALSRLPHNGKDQPNGIAVSTKGLPALPKLPNTHGADRVLAAGDVLNKWPSEIAYGWGVATVGSNIWLSNLGVAGGDNLDYEYTPDGTKTGDTVDDSGAIEAWAADGAFDSRTGNFWRVNVVNAGSSCIFEIDPVNNVVTGNTICPNTGTSERGLAYDQATDTFYMGSWNDGAIKHFDLDGNILDSSFVALSISGLAYNSSNGHLLVMQNFPGGNDITVLDALNGYAVLGSYPILDNGAPAITAFGGAGAEFDCLGNLWVIDQNTQTVYQVESGESAGCAVDIPWLTVDPTEGTVAANGGTATSNVSWDSLNYLPGLKQAQLQFKTDTPFTVPGIPVSMVVRFLDVPDDNIFEAFIYGAAGAGVMFGGTPVCSDNLHFCPDGVVTRADMAGYLYRAINGSLTPPPVYQNIFNDVSFNDYNAFYIQGIFDLGITAGCQADPPLYCPNNPNTRAQMSVFIWKGQHGDEPPPACTGVFTDVPCPGGFAVDYIEGLFNEGVTAGCGGGNFCPNANITNGQMAVFLVKGFNIPHL